MKKVEITHPEKILFPKGKITKQQLVDHYSRVSSKMLPLIKDRPISMLRFPHGINEEGFFQKNAPEGIPSWVKTVKVERKEKEAIHMILCNDKETLLWLTNQNCITPHIWLSKYDRPDIPDRMIFDLDPPPRKDFKIVVEGAFFLKEVVEQKFHLKPFVTTTGSKGLHVVIPIKRKFSFDDIRSFAREIAEILVKEEPKKYTTEPRKEKRKGRLYIDTLRNGHGQTVVAPYSVRPYEGAPVATPLFWEELKDPHLRSDAYHIDNMERRLKKNPWQRIEESAKTLVL